MAINAKLIALRGSYTAHFECTCKTLVIMPIHDDVKNISRTHCGCSGSKLIYLGSSTIESVSAYESKEGWGKITQALSGSVSSVESEQDSQIKIRSYLIEKGYAFLGGQGSLGYTDISKTEFTTFHPSWSIEEPGFSNKKSVVLVPRLAQSKLSNQFVSCTWPDFVVWDGETKIAIELKTPKKWLQGSESRLFSLKTKLNDRNTIILDKKSTEFGITAVWLLQYADDIHREAEGRKVHMPEDYKNVFLIDLTVTKETPASVWKDLMTLMKRSEKLILSEKWWSTYWGDPLFFYGGKIVTNEGKEAISCALLTYDQIASVFASVTKCTKCSINIPTKERNEYGFCWFCTRMFEGRCVKCSNRIPDNESSRYSVCRWCVWAAQMICNHLKSEQHELQNKMCDLCFGTLIGPY